MSKALKKNDIALIKCLASPPPLVVVELSCTALILGLPERQAKVCPSYLLCYVASPTVCIVVISTSQTTGLYCLFSVLIGYQQTKQNNLKVRTCGRILIKQTYRQTDRQTDIPTITSFEVTLFMLSFIMW